MNFELKTLTLDSREVAKMLDKNHADLLRDIARNIEYLTESNFALSEFFQENQYKDSTGRKVKRYDITKKGCEFLAHKLTGKKGAIFTATYINKFHELEQQLANSKLPFEEETKIVPTTWRGQPVMELQELAKMICVNGVLIHWHFQKEKLTLKKNKLREYKKENKTNRGQASLSILYKETVISICKHFKVYEKYKDIIENYFKVSNKIEYKAKIEEKKVIEEKEIDVKKAEIALKALEYVKDDFFRGYVAENLVENLLGKSFFDTYNLVLKANEFRNAISKVSSEKRKEIKTSMINSEMFKKLGENGQDIINDLFRNN